MAYSKWIELGPALPNGIETKETETLACLLLLVLNERWDEWARVLMITYFVQDTKIN